MLDWLPLPHEFNAQLREASRVSDVEKCADRLAALANLRLDFLQTIQLSRAMDALLQRSGTTLPRHRLAILGSATLDHLVPAIRVAALRRQIWLDAYCGGFGQYRQELMDPQSAVHRFAPQTIVLSIAAAHTASSAEPAATASEVEDRLSAVVSDLSSLWTHARETMSASVIQQTFLNVSEPLFGSYDRLAAGSPWHVTDRLNQLVSAAAQTAGVTLLDIDRAAQMDGRDYWYDATRMFQAKQEIAPQAAPAYGELLGRILGAQRGASKKCLVMDLDNTLWGGVLGEDGVQGLVLGQGSAVGEAHLAVQAYARQLRDRGIILAVCSKNDPIIAADAFDSHPEMLLRRSDIAAFVANWNDKAANLVAIANQLNIGVDSLVFLDDNPAERARIREALPAVGVPELPDDVAGYVSCLARAGYFEAVSFTAEDRQRAEQYAQNVERETMRGTQSMSDFLEGLRMRLAYGPFAQVDLPRVVQLINKTNQFNPTTRRYSAEQVIQHLATPGAMTLQFRLRDRFGDNGLVSAMILLPVAGAPDCLEIDLWIMSCRVFGRQLEHEALNIAVENARRAGIREIVASYSATAKNAIVSEIYPQFGFKPADLPAQATGTSRWSLLLSEYAPRTTHIFREGMRP